MKAFNNNIFSKKNRKVKSKIITFSMLIVALVNSSSCTKLVEVDPPLNSINAQNVYATDATAAAVLTGIYTDLSSKSNYTNNGLLTLSLTSGLSADEFNLFNGANVRLIAYYKNSLSSSTYGFEFWNILYPYIFTCNSAIEGLTNSTTLTPIVKKQLLGEAKFIRAFLYFNLINLYGDVPLVLTTDYTINSNIARSSKSIALQQVITDLKEAQQLLNDDYIKADAFSIYPIATAERVRPNKWIATALLARAYLYNEDWVNAEAQATIVINNTVLFGLSTVGNTFMKASLGNKEAIWQLQPVNTGWNTEDAKLFIIPSTGLSSTNPVQLSTSLLSSFESGDLRKTNWVGSVTPTPPGTTTYYYPNKYKSATNGAAVNEYMMILRLAEQYLIRAEARAQQNNISGAQSDLNIIRGRAGLGITPANDKASLLIAILHERQVEFFSEWGHRWFDLKRTGTIDAVMTVAALQKGSTWNSYQQLYPLPIIDLQRNPSLTQNSGY